MDFKFQSLANICKFWLEFGAERKEYDLELSTLQFVVNILKNNVARIEEIEDSEREALSNLFAMLVNYTGSAVRSIRFNK